MGLAADVGVLQRLPRIVGEGRTREMAYTVPRGPRRRGRADGPGQRLRRGSTTPTRCSPTSPSSRADLAAKSPLALRGTKHAITYARDHTIADGLEQIATWNAAALLSDDLTEAVAAFAEKRAPRYTD